MSVVMPDYPSLLCPCRSLLPSVSYVASCGTCCIAGSWMMKWHVGSRQYLR